jgi:hypothetical protein
MTMKLSKSLIKSLQKAYGQYLNASQPRTYNSIYSNLGASPIVTPSPRNVNANTSNSTPKKTNPYVYHVPNFADNTKSQSNPKLELEQFQQAQQQLLQNQRMQQMYTTTRNAGQMNTQNSIMPAPPRMPQSTAIPTPATTPPRLSHPSNPPTATADYGESNSNATSTPKSTTTEGFDMTKPTTSIEDKNPSPSTGASILGTTTKRYSGIRKSSKLTENSSQYMYEGTGKVPNLPSTDRSIPRNSKYF